MRSSATALTVTLIKSEVGGVGFTPDYSSFRNTFWGQTPPVDYMMLKKAYLEDPIVYRCVQVLTNGILSNGYILKGGSIEGRKHVLDLLQLAQFSRVLRDLVIQLIAYGDAYVEVARNSSGQIEEFYPHDASTIRVDYDEHGIAFKYIQRVLHRRIDFLADEMIHFSLNNFGGRVYGHSMQQPVLETVQTKFYAERYTAEFFRRGAIPRLAYILKNYSEEQKTRFVEKMRAIQPNEDIALVGEAEVKEIGLKSNADMQFKELLDYLRGNILACFGVPPILVGLTKDKDRGAQGGQSQLEAFDDHVRGLRAQIADVLNHEFFTIENFGVDIIFEFNEDNTRENLRRAQVGQLMASMPGVFTKDEIRVQMGYPPIKAREEATGVGPGSAEEDEVASTSDDFVGDPKVLGQTNPAESNSRSRVERRDNAEERNTEQQKDAKKYVNPIPKDRESTFGATPLAEQPPGQRLNDLLADNQQDVHVTTSKPIEDALSLNSSGNMEFGVGNKDGQHKEVETTEREEKDTKDKEDAQEKKKKAKRKGGANAKA
jgi:HK97 family phage portal protein